MTTPRVAHTRAELADLLVSRRAQGQRVGLVPTMGALHEGHAGLMRVAREHVAGGPVVVSIFVNPLQFGEGEDLDRYPRTLEADLKLCEREGVDIVFAPGADEVYPGGEPMVTVEPGPLANVLEGRTRPGHFRGVLTVVAKLFGLVRPDVAVFGQKDYQQLVLIRRMVADLCLPVEVVGAETEREPDGLALSSRNSYLDDEQRREAVTLNRTLRAAQNAAKYGVDAALSAARAELRASKAVDLDYLAITTPDLADLPDEASIPPGTEARVLIAARVGATRLIDNLPLVIGSAPGPRVSRFASSPLNHRES
ncbi:MAG: pantoate--beta-alanine ligase [Actinomycetota bacterium]|nr:pantoate--beta-alanine ligase [Actinomycetota bacterium]